MNHENDVAKKYDDYVRFAVTALSASVGFVAWYMATTKFGEYSVFPNPNVWNGAQNTSLQLLSALAIPVCMLALLALTGTAASGHGRPFTRAIRFASSPLLMTTLALLAYAPRWADTIGAYVCFAIAFIVSFGLRDADES